MVDTIIRFMWTDPSSVSLEAEFSNNSMILIQFEFEWQDLIVEYFTGLLRGDQ